MKLHRLAPPSLALASPIQGYVPQARRIERWIGALVWGVFIAVLVSLST